MSGVVEKGIIDLLTSLTTGEIISLMFMIGGFGFYGIKWYSHVKKFVKETAKEEIQKEGERTDNDKVKEQLSDLRGDIDKLLTTIDGFTAILDKNVNEQINTINSKMSEIKNIIDTRLIALNDQMIDVHKEVDEKLLSADNIHKELMNNLNILKMSIERLEMTIKDMSPENKMLHQETMRQVQAVSKDLATLQGTIIGNMSSSRTTLR